MLSAIALASWSPLGRAGLVEIAHFDWVRLKFAVLWRKRHKRISKFDVIFSQWHEKRSLNALPGRSRTPAGSLTKNAPRSRGSRRGGYPAEEGETLLRMFEAYLADLEDRERKLRGKS